MPGRAGRGTVSDMTANLTEVLIAGGGVAGLETLLALRDLAGDRVHVSMLAPEPDFVYRPLGTAEPFSLGHPPRRPLWQIADELGATLIADGLAEVRPGTREVRCTSGTVLPYDALVVTLGAVSEPLEHTTTFVGEGAREAMGGVLADLEQGYSRSVAFVAPSEGWTLPLYELAILTAREVWAMGMDDVRFSLVTPEERPLGIFGEYASTAIAELLAAERIEFVGSTSADGGLPDADRVVALPRLRGPAVRGLPADGAGFIPVDAHGRVAGLEDVYAAGDATDFHIKQGGLSTQQADAVAEMIAQRAGAPVDPQPFRPVLRGLLLTGDRDRYLLSASEEAGGFRGYSDEQPLWWPPTKMAGRYLAPYLYAGAKPALAANEPDAAHLLVETKVALGAGRA